MIVGDGEKAATPSKAALGEFEPIVVRKVKLRQFSRDWEKSCILDLDQVTGNFAPNLSYRIVSYSLLRERSTMSMWQLAYSCMPLAWLFRNEFSNAAFTFTFAFAFIFIFIFTGSSSSLS